MTSRIESGNQCTSNWTAASKRLTCWLISMSLEQIWLLSIDFSQRCHIVAFWLLFVIHNLKNWWKHELILTHETAAILQCFYVDFIDVYFVFPTMLWEKCNQSKFTGWSENALLLNFPCNMLSNAHNPLVWFSIRLSHEFLPAHLFSLPSLSSSTAP